LAAVLVVMPQVLLPQPPVQFVLSGPVQLAASHQLA